MIYKKNECNNAVIYTLSSGTAAMLCDLVTNPMWIVRIRKQTEFIHSGCQKMDSFNVWSEIIKLYKKVKIKIELIILFFPFLFVFCLCVSLLNYF